MNVTASGHTDDESKRAVTGGGALDESPHGKQLVLIAIVYLLGLFIGALDTGIVTPARTVIQSQLGVPDAYGVWMITIYTLAYAVSIPIMGKLADKFGRKWVYLISVSLFGAGSLLCGLSQDIGSFEFLLVSRAIQALGGGGIVPVATAEFGTTFPPEKRGMALGLVGGVYGIANIFGASAGSLVLDICGQSNWQFIFYINVPITIFIVIVGIYSLPNSKESNVSPIDALGIFVLSIMTLSLLYGLRNIDFFDLGTSIAQTDVYPFLITTIVLLPIFILVEHRAKDPVMNLSYFKNPNILITLVLSITTGVVIMGMIFVPQYAENALRLPSGDGGYFVIILGLFAGIGAPVSGNLIDRFGVKIVLGFGLAASIIGSLYLALISTANPSLFNVVVSLVLIGLGVGFTMGTPLNYMMLEHTDPSESNSALATLSLVRSIGTAIAPAIMVGFITHGVANLQDSIVDVLPNQVTVAALPHQHELQNELDNLKSNEDTADMVADMDMPDLDSMQNKEIDMNADGSDYEIPDYLIQMMKDSDITTISSTTNYFVSVIFDEMSPDLISDVNDGVDKGIDGMQSGRTQLDEAIDEMNDGIDSLSSGIEEIETGIDAQYEAREQMVSMLPTLEKYQNYSSVLDILPDAAKAALPQKVLDSLGNVKTAADLQEQMDTLEDAISQAEAKRDAMAQTRDGLQQTVNQLQSDPVANKEKIAALTAQIEQMDAAIDGINSGIEQQEDAYQQMASLMPMVQKMNGYSSVLDLMPDSVKASIPSSVLDSLSSVRTAEDLQAQIDSLDGAISEMTNARDEMENARDEMQNALTEMEASKDKLGIMTNWMNELKAGVPGAFEDAKQTYMQEVDSKSGAIEEVFQDALNNGFRGIFMLVAITSSAGLVLLLFYRGERKGEMYHKLEKKHQKDPA